MLIIISVMELTIDRGFKPDLLERADSEARQLFQRWEIDPIGIPISSRNSLRTALWHSERFNEQGEGIAFLGAANLQEVERREVHELDFYFGVVTAREVEKTDDRLGLFAETATISCTKAADYKNNFNFLVKVLAAYIEPPPSNKHYYISQLKSLWPK